MNRLKSFKLFERDDFYGDSEIEECEETISTIRDTLLDLSEDYICQVELTPLQWSKNRSWSPEITISIKSFGFKNQREQDNFDFVINSILDYSTQSGYKTQTTTRCDGLLTPFRFVIELYKGDI